MFITVSIFHHTIYYTGHYYVKKYPITEIFVAVFYRIENNMLRSKTEIRFFSQNKEKLTKNHLTCNLIRCFQVLQRFQEVFTFRLLKLYFFFYNSIFS